MTEIKPYIVLAIFGSVFYLVAGGMGEVVALGPKGLCFRPTSSGHHAPGTHCFRRAGIIT